MKLRLQITASSGATTTFEHGGPVIRVGRHPTFELQLDQEHELVSREHARIELTPSGATLIDTKSSNGTFHNEADLRGRPEGVPLREGDRIWLGQTERRTILKVVELDLAAPAAAVPSKTLLLVGGGVLAVLLLAGVGWFVFGRKQPPVEVVDVGPVTGVQPTHTTSPEVKTVPKEEKTEPKKEWGEKSIPITNVRPVGKYISQPNWPANVLLQRQSELYPWAALRPQEQVLAEHTLVSPPGSRCLITLDSGVDVELWGSLPELEQPPIVLECVATVHQLKDNTTDAQVTLDRGRLRLANRKSAGPARVVLRFLNETWELTLADKEGMACVELWRPTVLLREGSRTLPAVVHVDLYARGRVVLRSGSRTATLEDKASYRWSSSSPHAGRQEQHSQHPPWWQTDKLDFKNLAITEALSGIKRWSESLTKADDVVDVVASRVLGEDADDLRFRLQGLYLLAALDEGRHLIKYLGSPDQRLREAAQVGLQIWLNRNPDHRAELTRAIVQFGYTHAKAELIVGLLHSFPLAELRQPETSQQLLKHLMHENLEVRHLAIDHLVSLRPDVAVRNLKAKVPYDPAGESEKRRQAVEIWKQALPPGTILVPGNDGKGS